MLIAMMTTQWCDSLCVFSAPTIDSTDDTTKIFVVSALLDFRACMRRIYSAIFYISRQRQRGSEREPAQNVFVQVYRIQHNQNNGSMRLKTTFTTKTFSTVPANVLVYRISLKTWGAMCNKTGSNTRQHQPHIAKHNREPSFR